MAAAEPKGSLLNSLDFIAIMTPSLSPIQPRHAGSPSRVIQGFFPGGRPRIIQATPAPVAPVRPPVPAPVQPRPASPPAPLLPGRPATGDLQPSPRPGQPPRPILPAKVQTGAMQPATPLRPQVPQPILPQPRGEQPQALRPRNATPQGPVVQRVGNGEAFQLPGSLTNFGCGGAQPLPDPVRQKMESLFNTSFADVRVHVGPQASSIGALAFTHGSNLYFAPGQYNPTTTQGRRILGHELTHVVQQRAGRVRSPFGAGVAVIQDRGMEAEAERMGMTAAVHWIEIEPRGMPRPPSIQRMPMLGLAGLIGGGITLGAPGAVVGLGAGYLTNYLLYGRQKKLTQTYYLSFDSWQNWDGSYKAGAEDKWNRLVDLYTTAVRAVNDDINLKDQKKLVEDLAKNPIGLSQYEAVLKTLNKILYIRDKGQLEQIRNAHKDPLSDEHDMCDFEQCAYVYIIGDHVFKGRTLQLLRKISRSAYAHGILLQIAERLSEARKILRFESNKACGLNPVLQKDGGGFRIDLNLDLRSYATGANWEIIPSTIEIALFHELGHLLKEPGIKIERGQPARHFRQLDPESQALWTSEEEYINISQIENEYRRQIGVASRVFHAEDPWIGLAEALLQQIVKDPDDRNIRILIRAEQGERDLLLERPEIKCILEVDRLMQMGESRTDSDILKIRKKMRKIISKVRKIHKIQGIGNKEYSELKNNAWLILSKHPEWAEKLLPFSKQFSWTE